MNPRERRPAESLAETEGPLHYELIDSGDERKLERFGPHILDRPSVGSVWSKVRSDAWTDGTDAIFHRGSDGGGRWEKKREIPDQWLMQLGDLKFRIQPTGFGHVGVFPEQLPFWRWIREMSEGIGQMEILNLFAYTGGSTLAAAMGDAAVTHCDASRGVVNWARQNAELCDLQDAPIRWIVEDARKYVGREFKRGRRYRGIVLDPPSFGRGPRGEVFKIEEHLPPLLSECSALLSDDAEFVLLTAHTPGLTGLALRHLLKDVLAGRRGKVDYGEMVIPERGEDRWLPSGSWASWSAQGQSPRHAIAEFGTD